MRYPATLTDITRAREHDQAARAYTKYLQAMGRAAADHELLDNVLERTPGLERFRQKAGVPAGGTSTLAPIANEAGRAWRDLLVRRTVLGQLDGTVPAPPNVFVPSPDVEPTPYWVREGAPLPLAQLSVDNPLTSVAKFGVLLAFQDELFRVTDDRALTLIERMSMRALRHAEDTLLLSADAAVAQTSPAGLLHGLTAAGSGSPANLQDQFLALWTEVSEGEPDWPYYILSARGAQYLASLHQDGAPLFPNVGPLGGTIHTVPVIIAKAAGNRVVLVDATSIAVTDEGLTVSRSEQAAIEMLDTPTGDAATPTGATSVVSLFQANAVALKFMRWLSWTLLTDDAVAFLELPFDNSPN